MLGKQREVQGATLFVGKRFSISLSTHVSLTKCPFHTPTAALEVSRECRTAQNGFCVGIASPSEVTFCGCPKVSLPCNNEKRTLGDFSFDKRIQCATQGQI